MSGRLKAPRNNRPGRTSYSTLPAERCPPTAGGKPVSFGLAAPQLGPLRFPALSSAGSSRPRARSARSSSFSTAGAAELQLQRQGTGTADGRKSLWVAAVARANAVEAVQRRLRPPPNCIVTLSERRLTLTRKADVLRRGEVRMVKL
jgi:hypothetical protein